MRYPFALVLSLMLLADVPMLSFGLEEGFRIPYRFDSVRYLTESRIPSGLRPKWGEAL